MHSTRDRAKCSGPTIVTEATVDSATGDHVPPPPTQKREGEKINHAHALSIDRLRLKRDGTRTETRFRLSAKRTSPFKSAGVSVQSTTVSRGMRISDSNAGYTMFRGSVKSTGYPLHSPVSPSLPLSCVTVCHHFNWTLTAPLILILGTISR